MNIYKKINVEVLLQNFYHYFQKLRRMLEKVPPHCCPSSEDEVRQFMWLGEETQAEVATS